jgi:CheY-like chemotaxis protein
MNIGQDGQQPVIVLLVEDEALVRMMAADVLREEGGFKVVEAADADEALTVLDATADVRALVTDVEMPGSLDGFTLARVVKQAWPQIGIVVTSGQNGTRTQGSSVRRAVHAQALQAGRFACGGANGVAFTPDRDPC